MGIVYTNKYRILLINISKTFRIQKKVFKIYLFLVIKLELKYSYISYNTIKYFLFVIYYLNPYAICNGICTIVKFEL